MLWYSFKYGGIDGVAIEPSGYLQWDDIDSSTMGANPPHPLTTSRYTDVAAFGTLLDMDIHFPSTITQLLKNHPEMTNVQVIVMDSLESEEIVKRTRELACAWYLDCVDVLIPLYWPLLKGDTREEALLRRDELVRSLKSGYEGWCYEIQ